MGAPHLRLRLLDVVTTPGAVVAGHYESREACVTAALGVKDVTGKIELSSKTIAYCVKVEKP